MQSKKYIDVKARRKEKKIKSPNELAKKMLRSGPIPTVRGEFTWDYRDMEDEGYRSLGNQIRQLEKGNFDWWKKSENRKALKKLAEVLEVSIEQIPLEEIALRAKRLFSWSEFSQASPFDPLEDKIADTGLVSLVELEEVFHRNHCIWYMIPQGWGKSFLGHLCHTKFDTISEEFEFDTLEEAQHVISKAISRRKDSVVSIRKRSKTPISKILSQLSQKSNSRILVLAPFIPEGNEGWKMELLTSAEDWQENFISWIWERTTKKKIPTQELIHFFKKIDPHSTKYPSPKSLLPLISLCYQKGLRLAQASIEKGDWAENLIKGKLSHKKNLASGFIKAVKNFITNPNYLLGQTFAEVEWEKMLKPGKVSQGAIDELIKTELLVRRGSSLKLGVAEWCLHGMSGNEIFLEVKKSGVSWGQFILDVDRKEYVDQALNQLPPKEWERVLEQTLEKEHSSCNQLVLTAEIEALFSSAARWFEQGIEPRKSSLYEELFARQMGLLRRWKKNIEAWPLTRPSKFTTIPSCEWIGDCWLWDLSGFTSIKKIPDYAHIYFPIHGKPGIKEWQKFLHNRAEVEAPAYIPHSPEGIYDPYHKNYLRLINLSFKLIPRLSLKMKDVADSSLLFPGWLVYQISKEKRPNIKTYEYLLSPEMCRWGQAVVHLANKYIPNKKGILATHFFDECLHAQREKKKVGLLELNWILKKTRPAPKLLKFFEENTDLKKCLKSISQTFIENWESSQIFDVSDKIAILSDRWKEGLLDALFLNKKGIKVLTDYIKNFYASSLKYSMLEENTLQSIMKRKHWKEIVDRRDKAMPAYWQLIWVLWEQQPGLAFQRAKTELHQGNQIAAEWFLSAPSDWIEPLSKELIEFLKKPGKRKRKIPDWCKSWLSQILCEPSVSSMVSELYELILV